jgi:hypothetical protein
LPYLIYVPFSIVCILQRGIVADEGNGGSVEEGIAGFVFHAPVVRDATGVGPAADARIPDNKE